MQKRHVDRFQYFRELAHTSEQYFIPYIKEHLDVENPISILETGVETEAIYCHSRKGDMRLSELIFHLAGLMGRLLSLSERI